MRNLTLWEVSVSSIEINSDDQLAICHGHNEGNSANNFYVFTHNLILKKLDKNGEIKWTKDLSAKASPNNIPLNITYLTLTNTLCVGLRNGEIITLADGVSNVVGVFDCTLLAMEWSPDQELLVLVTKEMNTILMSCAFDPINEVHLLDKEFGAKQFITVGWGKKETQFHGSAGKQAAKIKNEVQADSALTDNTVKITWRGDGHLYAIGFTMDGIKRFKVFDREGNLQYTSEKQQGLESNLSWRPSGNLIATTQRLPEKYLVSFFEKNGLKHGEFDITDKFVDIEDIVWSSDSEILTLLCRNKKTNTQMLLLYTTSNYHWYLKQTLPFDEKQKISKIIWDNDFDVANNKKLYVILHDGTYYMFNWIWNIDHSNGNCAKDDSIVAVIDGNKILLTGFRQTIFPPPMSALEIKLDIFINSVHFAPKTSKLDPNNFFICTSNNKLIFYKQTEKNPLQYKEYKTVNLNKYDFPFQNYNWYWVTDNKIVCVTVDNYYSYNLVEYTIESSEILKRNTVSLLSAPVTRIQAHPMNTGLLFLELNNGHIAQYELGGTVNLHDLSFDTPCPKFDVLFIENTLYFIGLSHKGNLFFNDRMIMNNVSSYFVHTHFLLLTTLKHVLLCTELTTVGLNAIVEYQKHESENIYKRKLERGAKLVIAVPHDTRTVFQMPRGNLETIQPRPLSLKIIGEHLNNCKYNEAFDLMRKQRINLNLFYDHDPEQFIKNINVFLDAINNNSWLNLFLSDLENLDVTKTMYGSCYVNKADNVKTLIDTKVQRICDIVRENLLKRSDTDDRILPVLTTFVKKNNVGDLEKALLIVKDLKIKESNGLKLPVSSEEALKYLLYMVDVNQLFDVALGMYDFDLVLLVANKSQKDPKEYIPMLNELNEMDENYKRFSINKHLKRFDKAVNALVQCGPAKYNELKTFVKYHSLYREALSHFTIENEIFKEISVDYGSYLKLKKQFAEAGIIFERANNFEEAVECYKEALEWEMAISLAQTWPKESFRELCWSFVNALRDEKRHREVLIILEQYYGDSEEAISYAIEFGQYKTAMRLCSQYKRPKLKDERLLPALMEDYKNLQEQIELNWCDFTKYRNRLSVVRENKSKYPAENFYDSYINRDSDLYSDAGSTLASSKGSSRSYRSSKNRRKHERKVASLKEGSQYEDVALVMTLHTLVTSSFELRLQVKEVVIALCCFNKDKEAFVLQKSLEKLLKEMKDSFKDIWTNELVLEATNAQIAAYNVPEGVNVMPQGIATLEPHIRIAPVIQDINWKLDGFN